MIFEGDYLNGKRNGKGKEYNENGLIFEGEYYNGKRWNGYGKEYDSQNQLIFEGEHLNGERNGKGKEYNEDILIFEGEYLYGERNGKGKEYFNNNKIKFEGEYLYGEKWNGIMYDYNQEFSFEIKNGKGKGKEYSNVDRKLIYEGEYVNGERNGKGKKYDDENKLIFEGEYLNGKKWNGVIKEYDYKNILKFDGKLINGEKNGLGKEYDEKGRLIYEGEYLNGKRHVQRVRILRRPRNFSVLPWSSGWRNNEGYDGLYEKQSSSNSWWRKDSQDSRPLVRSRSSKEQCSSVLS